MSFSNSDTFCSLQISQKSLIRKTHGSSPVSYGLVDGAKHTTFLEAFPGSDISSSVVLVAYKPRRGKSALYRGPLTLEGVEDFVTRALGGDLTFESINQKPTLL